MLRDQQHGIHVYRHVRRRGCRRWPALFAAALLHDCGKGRVTMWQRIAHVCLGGSLPGDRPRIADEEGTWLAAGDVPAAVPSRHRGGSGGERGSDPETVRLIREQEQPEPDARLALLQAADNM